MAKDKKGFRLYEDQYEIFQALPDEMAGKLIKLIFSYVNDENPVEDDLMLKLAFTPIKQQLKRDLKKYESICERNRKNANMRWHASALSGTPKSTKNADTDNDTDNDTDTDNDIKINNRQEPIDFDRLLEFFNKTFNKRCTAFPDKIKDDYRKRLKKDYTKENIMDAMINVKNDPFHIETKYKHCTIGYFSRIKTLDTHSFQSKEKKKYIPTL